MTKHELTLHIELDDKQVPERLAWQQEHRQPIKAFFLNTWEEHVGGTASLHLWDKTFSTQQMKNFFYQTLVAMVESLERAVPDEKSTIKDLYATCNYLAEKFGLLTPEQIQAMIEKSHQANNLGQQDVDLTHLIDKKDA